jgi:hypothetical protein
VLGLFGRFLFSLDPAPLSVGGSDLATQYLYWREFGFGELREGNLPLWNPHVFSGIPFFGGFQSALLYPPNWIYAAFPLHLAVNVGIALHVFLAGLFMYLWATSRGLHRLAAFYCGVALMLCGAHFSHVYAGHLSNLCAIPWVPLVFLALDRVLAHRTVGWAMLGATAWAMLVLAGHPQYLFYTVVAFVLYGLLRAIRGEQRLRIAGLVAGMGAVAVLLTVMQLWVGLQEAPFTVRGGGVDYRFASRFSFPPENLVTLLAPQFLGSLADDSYWGRCYLTGMSLFFGITAVVLAVFGVTHGRRQGRGVCAGMVVILFVLALGAHTPLFRWLYELVPGFDRFRGSSKFTYPMTLFAILLAGIGLHRLAERPALARRWGSGAAVAALLLAVGALVLRGTGDGPGVGGAWNDFMKSVHAAGATLGESYRPLDSYDDPVFVRQAARRASQGLAVAVGTFGLIAVLFGLAARARATIPPRAAVYGLVTLGIAELILFAWPLRVTFDGEIARFPDVRTALETDPGDYRILNTVLSNSAMATGALDIGGFDPGTLRRYAEFVAATQGADPEAADQYLRIRFVPRTYAMLRVKYAAGPEEGRIVLRRVPEPPFPRLSLWNRYEVRADRDEALARLVSPDFDFRNTLLLERAPDPLPDPERGEGTVRLLDESTDHLSVEARLPAPAILLITDAYHPHWRARSLPGSAETTYDVIPANRVLRAIPLSAGRHRIRLEYSIPGFMRATTVSAIAWIALLAGGGVKLRRSLAYARPTLSRAP